MTLTQKKCIAKLIEKFSVKRAKKMSTPMELHLKVSKEMSPKK